MTKDKVASKWEVWSYFWW